MQFQSRTITLKDGRTAVLRTPRVEDAPELLAFLKQITTESSFIMREPDECTDTVEQEIAFITQRVESEHALMLVCEIDGRIVGSSGLQRKSRRKIRHRATLDIAILREFWNLGIGSAFFRAHIETGRAMGLEQLELSYVEGNVRGCALYEKMGVTEIARHPNALHLSDGTIAAEIFMVKKL